MNSPKDSLPAHAGSSVPSFTCIIYVSKADIGVEGRVANLNGIQDTAPSQRDLIAKLLPRFKAIVADAHSGGKEIPWVDPPSPIAPGESTLYIPMHL